MAVRFILSILITISLTSWATAKNIKPNERLTAYEVLKIQLEALKNNVIKGAALDVFKGSKKLLNNVLKIVCEVEFVPLYQDQPLFGDVSKFLSHYNLMFNKFLKLSKSTLHKIIF